MGEGRIAANLLIVLVFWLAIWISARLAECTGLSALLYYLIFGAIAGNFEIGAMDLHHSHFLKTFAVLAISVVFFALGLEEEVGNFVAGVKKAWGIALIGAIVPFGIGFGCTTLFWPDDGQEVALMGGLAVTATAVSLTMITLRAKGLQSTKAAMGIMTSAVLDDIGSLAFVAICVPIATGESSPTIMGIGATMGKAIGFFVFVSFVHCYIYPETVKTWPFNGFQKTGIKSLLAWKDGSQATLFSLTVGMGWCMMAHVFGFHPAIGAYMGGLIMEKSYYDVSEFKSTFKEVLHHIEQVAYGWMGPYFFMELGSTIIIDPAMLGGIMGPVFIFFIALFIGQFVSAAGAARFVPWHGFEWADACMIGFGMMGRAELFFVVLELCYVEHHIMNREQLCTFALVAMLMNISVPVSISLFRPFYCKWNPNFDQGGAVEQGPTICANCSQPLEQGWKHCPSCGDLLSAQAAQEAKSLAKNPELQKNPATQIGLGGILDQMKEEQRQSGAQTPAVPRP